MLSRASLQKSCPDILTSRLLAPGSFIEGAIFVQKTDNVYYQTLLKNLDVARVMSEISGRAGDGSRAGSSRPSCPGRRPPPAQPAQPANGIYYRCRLCGLCSASIEAHMQHATSMHVRSRDSQVFDPWTCRGTAAFIVSLSKAASRRASGHSAACVPHHFDQI